MYRPLVQPKFHTSRGQNISPDLSLMATGGPKQRGQLIVPNPHLLRNAEGWGGGDLDPCSTVTYDGRVELSLVAGNCNILFVDALIPVTQGHRYQAVVSVPAFSGFGAIVPYVGGYGFPDQIEAGGPVTQFLNMENAPINQEVRLAVIVSSNLDIIVDYFGVTDLGEY